MHQLNSYACMYKNYVVTVQSPTHIHTCIDREQQCTSSKSLQKLWLLLFCRINIYTPFSVENQLNTCLLQGQAFLHTTSCLHLQGGGGGGGQALPLKCIHDIIIVDVAGPLLIGSSKNSIEPRACATLKGPNGSNLG